MQRIIIQETKSKVISFIIFFTIFIFSFYILILPAIAQNNSNWQIIIELYPETPAKNQEVFLIVRVEDSGGPPVQNMSLNITLKNLMVGPDEKEIQFLNNPNPKTGEKGEYTTVFNAAVFEWHRDGVYEIMARIKLNDGTIISNSKEFHVKEKRFDTEKDNLPESGAPGAWYTIYLYNVDFKPFTVSISQNGDKEQITWEKNDWKSAGGMYEGNEETGEEKTIYEIHSIKEEFNVLYRLDGDSQTLIDMEGYPDKTLIYKFLITEIFGKEIDVTFNYQSNGQQATKSYKIPTVELLRPTYGLTDRIGRWWFFKYIDDADQLGTEQNNDVLIYGIGFKDKINVKIFNETDLIYEDEKTSENYVAISYWHVPKDISIGYYNMTIGGYDTNNNYIEHKIIFYICEEPEVMGGIVEDPFSEILKQIFLLIPLIIILLIILGIFGYSRIKRKNLLNNIIRKRIYEHINSNPGVHFRGLLADLNLKTGTLAHHIKALIRENLIKEYQDGIYKRFSIYDKSSSSKFILPNIQDEILKVVKENPGISQIKISKLIGNSRFVVNYHTKILNHSGMIFIKKDGRTSHCYLSK
jgi:predicted transcriptional regulator